MLLVPLVGVVHDHGEDSAVLLVELGARRVHQIRDVERLATRRKIKRKKVSVSESVD